VRKNDSELNAAERGSMAKLEIAFFPELFSPAAGFSALGHNIRFRFDASNFKITDATGERFPFKDTTQPDIYDVGRVTNIEDDESKVGGTIGIRSLLETSTGNRRPLNAGSPSDSVPPTAEVKVAYNPKLSEDSNLLGIEGTVKVTAYAPHESPNPIQTFTFNFPPTEVRIPRESSGTEFAQGPATGASKKGNKISRPNAGGEMTDGRDTIRSLLPNGPGVNGDMRMIAARELIEETAFGPGSVTRPKGRKPCTGCGTSGVSRITSKPAPWSRG
jgi:hypothetical protein